MWSDTNKIIINLFTHFIYLSISVNVLVSMLIWRLYCVNSV